MVNSELELFGQQNRSHSPEQVGLCLVYACVFRFLVAAEAEQSLTGHNGLSQTENLAHPLGWRVDCVRGAQEEGRGTTC